MEVIFVKIRLWVAATCIVGGASLLAIAGKEWVTAREHQRRLEAELTQVLWRSGGDGAQQVPPEPKRGQEQPDTPASSSPPGPTLTTSGTTIPQYEQGQPVARLQIPRIGVDNIVLYGTSERSLEQGPALVERTAFPGEQGNAVIAAHRDYFFWRLRELVPGDAMTVTTAEGRWRYVVTSRRVVKETDTDVLAPTPGPTVTLITCWPLIFSGRSPERLVIAAMLVE